jgi:hypothetical protein
VYQGQQAVYKKVFRSFIPIHFVVEDETRSMAQDPPTQFKLFTPLVASPIAIVKTASFARPSRFPTSLHINLEKPAV